MAESPGRPARQLIKRHSLMVRITHWINVVCLTGLLMSGLQIFNAHPALYWGQAADFSRPLLAMDAEQKPDGSLVGTTTLLGHRFDTTGVLGVSAGDDGPLIRGFPSWATLPGPQWLAMGRRWHFFFAWLFVLNGLVYLGWGLASGHFRRDLWPSSGQLRQIGPTVAEHLRLHFPRVRDYNILQKLAYLVVLVLLALIVLAGLTMSPRLDAGLPFLVTLFDGRQSARTIHFLLAASLLAFVLIHLVMVVLSGLINNLRSMITGLYTIDDRGDRHEPQTRH